MTTERTLRPDPDEFWHRVVSHAGEEFRQIRGKAFTYEVQPGGLKPSTTNRLISRSQFEAALGLVPLANTVPVQHLQGPSYIYAILMDPRIRRRDW